MGSIKLLAIFFVAVFCILADAHPGCGTYNIPKEEAEAHAAREREILAKRGPIQKKDITMIAVNFHELYWQSGPYIPAGELDMLITVANDFFAPTGIQFYLDSHDFYDCYNNNKPNWWTVGAYTNDDRELRSYLKIGNSRNLNIYFVDLLDYAGVSFFPSNYAYDPLLDGIIIKYSYFQGTTPSNIYYKQMWLHEIGHWVGLYHTHQGGCDAVAGDYVADTPAELEPHFYCEYSDSCPSLPGPDPVWNVMSYAIWYCPSNMSVGQIQRAIEQVGLYRVDAPVSASNRVTTDRSITSGAVTSKDITTAPGLTTGLAAGACTNNGYMRCISSTSFQTCSNGMWYAPQSCQSGLYCTPWGNYIYCGYTNPTTTTTTSTTSSSTTTTTTTSSTTKAVTSSAITSGAVTSKAVTSSRLTTNTPVGAALVINPPALYHVSLSTKGANDYWIDTHSYHYGDVQQMTISWGPEYGKPFIKEDGQYDDPIDPTVTHVWTTLTAINGTNFFPSNDQISQPFYKWTGTGDARWRSEDILFGSPWYLLGTDLKVWDSNGVLRGHGGTNNINRFFDYNDYTYVQIDTYAPMDYTGNPINTKVTFELIARRANNQPITSGAQPITSGAQPITSRGLTTKLITTAGVTTRAAAPQTTGLPFTTAAQSTTCTVGHTKCISGSTYQTCVWTAGTGGWVGGWGANQNCPTGTNCVQYNTYIGCS